MSPAASLPPARQLPRPPRLPGAPRVSGTALGAPGTAAPPTIVRSGDRGAEARASPDPDYPGANRVSSLPMLDTRYRAVLEAVSEYDEDWCRAELRVLEDEALRLADHPCC